MPKQTTLRTLRLKKFRTLDGFCKEFKKTTGETLHEGTLSNYERGLLRISTRRLDLFSKILGISKQKKKELEEEMGGDLMYKGPYKPQTMTKVRKPRVGKPGTTVHVSHGKPTKAKPAKFPELTRYKKVLNALQEVADTTNTEVKRLAFEIALKS